MSKIDPRIDPAELPGQASASASGTRLSGKLSATAIVFMVVAAAAPLTVIASTPIGLALTNGGGVPFNYLAAGAILLVFAVGFTAMAHHITDAGAFYTFIGSGLGRVVGGAAAFLALFSYMAIQTAIYAFLGFSASNLVAAAGLPHTPWYLWSAIAMVIIAFLGYRNIDLSAKVLGVLLILEVLVIVVLSFAILLHGGWTGKGISFDSFTPGVIMSGPVGLGIMLAFGGFTGFESTAIFRDEARTPHKTIPRATYAAVIGIGAFYTLATWMLVEAWGSSHVQGVALKHTGDFVQLTATNYVGSWLATAVTTLLVTSLFACVISFHNVNARYLHSIGRIGLLPTRLSSTHPRHRSPHFASILVSVISVLLLVLWAVLGWDPLLQVFTLVSSSAVIGIILLFILTSVSVVVFFRRTKLDRRPWNTLIAPALAFVGLIAILYLTITNFSALTGTPEPALNTTLILASVLAFAIGLGIVLWTRSKRPETYKALTFHHREARGMMPDPSSAAELGTSRRPAQPSDDEDPESI